MKKSTIALLLSTAVVIIFTVIICGTNSALQSQVEYLEKLHFAEGKPIFNRVQVLSTEASEVTFKSGDKKKEHYCRHWKHWWAVVFGGVD